MSRAAHGSGWRPLIAALLSAVVPGAGQIYAGERRRGWVLLGVAVLLVLPAAVLLILVLYGPGGLDLAITVSRPFFQHPELLLVLLAVNLALAAFRMAVAVDAYQVARTRPHPAGGWRLGVASVVVAVIVVGLVTGPHYWAGRRNLSLYDLFTHEFVADPATTTIAPAPTTTPTTMPPTSGSTTPHTSPATTTIATTTTSHASSPFAGTERVNVLLMGGDAGPDRYGIRTDSMIVASIDPVSGEVALFGVPRNIKVLPIPDWLEGVWECDCYEEQSNTIYQYGLQHPELFPDGANTGATAAKALVGELLGLDIQYFALVDMLGFIHVIDAIGGVTIKVNRAVTDEFYTQPDTDIVPVDIQPGTYHMDGETALAFARVRRGQSDYERMDRQRCVLAALAAEADPMTVLRELPSLVPAVEGSLLTDIPVADWPDIIEFLGRTDTSRMTSVRFIPAAPELAGTGLSYIDGFTADRFGIPNVPLIQSVVQQVLGGDFAGLGNGVPSLDEVCG